MKNKIVLAAFLALLLGASQGLFTSQASHGPDVVDLGARAQNITFQGGSGSMVGLSASGDFDGDGVSDIVLQAQEGPASNEYGVLHLFKAASLAPGANFDLTTHPADVTIIGPKEWGPFQWATMRDVNGDGKDDVLAGATMANGPAGLRRWAGQVVIIFGRANSPTTIDLATQPPDVAIYGPTSSYDFGFPGFGSPTLVADVNGDGQGDIITSNYQGVYVIYGGPSLTSGTVIQLGRTGGPTIVEGRLEPLLVTSSMM